MTILGFIYLFILTFFCVYRSRKKISKLTVESYFLILGLLVLYPATLFSKFVIEITLFSYGVISFSLLTLFLKEKYLKGENSELLYKKKKSVMVKLPLLGGMLFLSIYQLSNFAPQKVLWAGLMLTCLLNGFFRYITMSKALISFYVLITVWVVIYYTVPEIEKFNVLYIQDVFFVSSFGVLFYGVFLNVKESRNQ